MSKSVHARQCEPLHTAPEFPPDPQTLLRMYTDAVTGGTRLESQIYSTLLQVIMRPLVDQRARAHLACPTCSPFYNERQVITEFMSGHAFYSDDEVRNRVAQLSKVMREVYGLGVKLLSIEYRTEFLWHIRYARIAYAGITIEADLETLAEVAGGANARLVSRTMLDVVYDNAGKLSPEERVAKVCERLLVHPDLQVSEKSQMPQDTKLRILRST